MRNLAPVVPFPRPAAFRAVAAPLVPSRAQIEQRCIDSLARLDAEQLQVVEVVIASIVRGGAA